MRVLLDACVLYPTVMREVLIGCAAAGLYEPRWSARILEEWARATVKLGPAEEVFARAEIATLRAAWPRAEVPAAPGLEQRLWLPDADDVHVLAAAVAGSCDLIVTSNAKDFPRGLLAEEGLARTDPDLFGLSLFDRSPEPVRTVVDRIVAEARRLSGQDWTVRGLLKKARMPQLGKALSRAL